MKPLYEFYMQRFKRNQVEQAVSRVLSPGEKRVSADLRNRVKRLLDTDRTLGRNARATDPEMATYAFYSSDAAGSGVEVWFREYEAFALLTGLQFLEHGFPQRTSVLALRRMRPVLEREHARILKLDPQTLFDEAAIRRAARPGQLVLNNLDPVFVVIYSGDEADRLGPRGKPLAPDLCRGEAETMRAIKADRGLNTLFEIVGSAHLLHWHLLNTKPSQRGRAPI
jgi:hypothetical protein